MKKIIFTITVYCLAVLLSASGFAANAPSSTQASAAEIIKQTLAKEGIEKAKQAFAEMQKAPEGAYAFSEKEFLALGDSLEKNDRTAEAIEIYRLCLEIFPDSPDILSSLTRSYRSQGDDQSFYKYFRQMISARDKIRLKEYLEANRGQLAATAAGVIGKHLEATGGKKAWLDISTMVVKFSVHDTSGSSGVLVRYYKRPGFYRQGFEGSQSFHSTDGKTVWRVTDERWQEIQENSYMRMSSMDDWFIDYETAGVKYEWIGVELLNHAPVYHLQRTYWDKYREDLYFSIPAGHLTEKLTPYNIGPTYFSFWDYRKIESILVPHVMIRNMGDMAPPHGLVLKEIKINVPLADSFFVRPENKD